MQPSPRNALALVERSADEHGPLEAWQEQMLEERKLDALGFGGDDEVPALNIDHHAEDELAWLYEKPIAKVDPTSASGYRFCGKRWVGEPIDGTVVPWSDIEGELGGEG